MSGPYACNDRQASNKMVLLFTSPWEDLQSGTDLSSDTTQILIIRSVIILELIRDVLNVLMHDHI